jgi:hypothetical protein
MSDTTKVYLPALRPVCDGLIVYGAVPEAGVITTLPSEEPWQLALTCVSVAVGFELTVIVNTDVC